MVPARSLANGSSRSGPEHRPLNKIIINIFIYKYKVKIVHLHCTCKLMLNIERTFFKWSKLIKKNWQTIFFLRIFIIFYKNTHIHFHFLNVLKWVKYWIYLSISIRICDLPSSSWLEKSGFRISLSALCSPLLEAEPFSSSSAALWRMKTKIVLFYLIGLIMWKSVK